MLNLEEKLIAHATDCEDPFSGIDRISPKTRPIPVASAFKSTV